MRHCLRRERGFRNRPRALRRAILHILDLRDHLTADEIAAIAFTARIVVRPGHRMPTVAEVVSTRRALRRLRAGAKVEKSGRVRLSSRQRRRDTFSLATKELPMPSTAAGAADGASAADAISSHAREDLR
jgi:hypothetical protein